MQFQWDSMIHWIPNPSKNYIRYSKWGGLHWILWWRLIWIGKLRNSWITLNWKWSSFGIKRKRRRQWRRRRRRSQEGGRICKYSGGGQDSIRFRRTPATCVKSLNFDFDEVTLCKPWQFIAISKRKVKETYKKGNSGWCRRIKKCKVPGGIEPPQPEPESEVITIRPWNPW